VPAVKPVAWPAAAGRAPGNAAALLLAFCLIACSSDEAKQAPPPPAEISLIGTSKAALVACAGTPATDLPTAGLDYLTYTRTQLVGAGYLQDASIPLIGTLAVGGKGVEVSCEATVIVKDGAVAAAGFRTYPVQGDQRTAELCKTIFQACLSK
jgi:hypothetical protein